jgi:polyferredoxin
MIRPRARHFRIVVQAFFLAAFLALFWGLAEPRVWATAASILLAIDPLTAIGTALSDWTVVGWTWLGLVVLAATAILGRFFCGWICPLGTLQHLVSWIAGPERRKLPKINRYRRWFSIKYIVLTVLLVWAALGANHIGWLDPISLLHRAFASGIRPLWHGGATPGGWVSFGLLAAILLLSAMTPRFFCRAACPLGALLGVFARIAPLRIRRDESGSCTSCTLCVFACQGADEPLDKHRVSECHVCLNCLGSCAEESLGYGAATVGQIPPSPALDVGRRRFLLTATSSAIFAPVLRAAGGGIDARIHDAVRPPGALDEEAFLARCITCGACSASCPTGVIRADLGRSGVEGLFTPILDMRRGWCEPSCIRCGEVCPTEALTVLDPNSKQAIGGPAEVSIGTAFLDRGRCLPWAMEIPCIVCEEMCPTSPKAVWLETVEITRRDGKTVTLQRPSVQPDLCTGCGLCENRCPVGEKAAIRVSSVGESRDPRNRMLQQRG